jgi:NAD/NADP transhydrogenase beta subunit
MTNPFSSNKGYTGATLTALVTLAGLAIAAVVTLTALNRPVDNVLTVLLAVCIPTLTGILNAGKLDKVDDKLSNVQDNVNGRMSTLISANQTLVSEREAKHSAD